ncbi:MAG: ABC transporter substrate binding protein [Desulfobacteraceae bacterium]
MPVIAAIYLLAFGVTAYCADSPWEKKILLLNSYHKGFLWTDEITRGVEMVLAENNVASHVDYMDTKRHSGRHHEDLLTEIFSLKHAAINYDAVIVSDNNAFNFFKQRGHEIFKDSPLIFCGVNNVDKKDLAGLTRVTGINEMAQISKNISLITRIHPDCRNILVITDSTPTGKRIQNQVREIQKDSDTRNIKTELVYDITRHRLEEKLSKLTSDTIVLMTVFFQDSLGHFFPFKKGVHMITSASKVPVYGTWTFQMGHGIIGGYLISGFQQGRAAAEQAVRIVSGTPVEDIPVMMDTPHHLYFDYRQLCQFNIDLDQLPGEKKILYQPSSIYHKYKGLIWITAFVFIVLLVSLAAVSLAFFHAKKARQQIAASEKQLRLITGNMVDVITHTDENYKIVYASPSMEKIFGYPPGELIGKTVIECVHMDDIEQLTKTILHARKNKDTALLIRYRRQHAKGHFIWAESAVRLLYDDQGKSKGAVFAIRDISEKKAYENQLLKFATVINQIDEEVLITDPKGIIQYVNSSLKQKTGYTDTELIGKTPSVFKSETHDSAFYRDMWARILDKKTWKGKITNKNKNGELTLYYMGITPILDAKQEISAFAAVKRDITEITRLEDQLRQSQKMEAIGTLASGIAHDFNNILSGIFAYLSLAAKHIETPDKAGKYLDQIDAGAKRAADLIQQILTFSRKKDSQKIPIQPGLIVKESVKFLEASIPANITIDKNIDTDSFVAADPTQIHQIVMNLCKNALYAMQKSGGTLSIHLKDIENSEIKSLPEIDVKQGPFVYLKIQDTGTGIPAKYLSRIFDPYFTTKSSGEGTGLGLAMVLGIVKEHKGHINAFSEPGKGTRFDLYFPRISNSRTAA